MAEAGVECVDCHKLNGEIRKPTRNFCNNCHEEEYEEEFLKKREDLKKLIGEVESILKTKEKEIYKNPEKYKNVILDFEKLAYEFHEFKKDNSLGAHNVIGYEEYLEGLRSKIGKF